MTNTITKITYDWEDYEVWTWDVVWPASATDGNLVLFDWATGKLIKDWWAVPTGVPAVWTNGQVLTVVSWAAAWANALEWNVKQFKLSSTSDTTTAQAAYDWYLAWNYPIIILWVEPFFLRNVATSSVWFIGMTYVWGPLAAWYNQVIWWRILLTKQWDTITAITYGEDDANVLVTDYNYSTPYTPLYNGSPATKKYVDDSMISTQANNILQSWMKIRAWEETDYANLWTYDSNTLYLTVPDSN